MPPRSTRKKKPVEEEEPEADDLMEDEESEEEDNDKSGNYREDGEESSEEEEEEPQEKYQFISEQTSKHLEKIRKEQKTLLNKLKEKQKKELAKVEDAQEKVKTSFKHLLEQTEIYSNFIPSLSMHTINEGNDSSAKTGGSRRKHSEKEEDEEIIREVLEEEEDDYQSVLLTSSPKFIENTTLRSYQIDGVNWLIRLHDRGVNGILADEMGLGKTVQTLTWIAYLKFIRRIRGPHLVVVPKSVIPNWVNQAAQWCPSLSVLKFHGDRDTRKKLKETQLIGGKFEVLVTSYEIAIKEKAALNKFKWYSIIIDEAHRIKNENSILSQCVRVFDCQYRLLLTGTPLQNNLHELWSLLNFLLPEVFNSADDFDTWFNLKEGQAETDIIEQLHKVLKPFMLRRLKTEVKTEIPPKKEIYVECGLSKLQKEWYRSILTKDLNAIKGGEKVRLLNVVMQLRKCCNHPYLFDGAEPGPPYTLGDHLINNSGKMVLMDKLLKRLKEQGSRVLIFTQMTRVLDILEDYCYYKSYEYCRIDGQTSSEVREQYLDEFNKEGSTKFIFLLSTRAGGLGINLATADTVIIFDSDWNPQADLQAQDRCHRIGQKKPVNVYRLISKDSIEEKIYQRAVKKLYLDAVVIQQGRLAEQHNKLSKTELMSMIKFGAEEVFKSTESTITDEDLDSILSRGEKKIQEIDQQYKQVCQNNLLNFSLTGESNLYEFEGLDYSKKATPMIVIEELSDDVTEDTLVQDIGEEEKLLDEVIISREKKSCILYFDTKSASAKALEKLVSKNYKAKFCKKNDKFILQLEEEAMKDESHTSRSERLGRRNKQSEQIAIEEAQTRRGPKEPKYYDFQFLNTTRLLELWQKESQYDQDKKTSKKKNKEAEESADEGEDKKEGLTPEEKQERKKLLQEGFNTWSKKDFQNYIRGCEKYGRNDIENIAKEVEGKSVAQVKKYSKVFWKRYKEIKDYDKIIKRIEKGESQLQKIDNNNLMLRYKTQKYINPWLEMQFNYGQNQAKEFTPEEDSFICCMTAKLGYGYWEEVKAQIRKAWEFRFDWFIKTRTASEIQKRCDTLIKLIEKEYQDDLKAQEREKAKRKLENMGSSSSTGSSSKKVKK
ncbi:hypothetical protein FDP41_010836 [Naegleria fowleri]|uniref:Uncharacterized protein n=1 Tax=Naegleria fowleri TaxID=5763 RepID=A0A6A5C053_NAEFO|nr:uncharacterized protein FDP41_010836 [Naegleria fowleri]KAF0982857.1 hypothetical protein FDP41_010836 [Naegleria fowleri]